MARRFPFSAFPTGWFALGFSDEVGAGEVVRRTFMGSEAVLYRTSSGHPALVGAYCPHMGAHFGFGGRVVGERLRCPMHGFEFDGNAVCVKTGYGTKPPPTCRGRAWPVCEVNGAIFAWHDPMGGSPTFEIPVLDEAGWTRRRTHRYADLPSHPQETSENSVDIGHFAAIHEYQNVYVRSELQTDGPYLTVGYHFERRPLFRGAPPARVDMQIHIHGLGYSLVEAVLPDYGLETRHWVLPSPKDGDHIDLRIGLRMRGSRWPLQHVPPRLIDALLGWAAIRTYINDVDQDYDIWANKEYVERPALAQGDGPIGKYRRWARQFYPTAEQAAAE